MALADLSHPEGAKLRRSDSAIVATDQMIEAGGAFTVSLKSFYVYEGHERDNSGNDLLVRSRVRYGDQPLTQVINFFEREVPPQTVKDNLEFEHIFARQDYAADARLWLELQIFEIDKGLDKNDEIFQGLNTIYAEFGGLFSALVPFASLAPALLHRIERLSDLRDQNKLILNSRLDLFAQAVSGGDAPLRCGAYVFFNQPVEAIQYRLRGLRLERSAPGQQHVPIMDDYAVIKIVPAIVRSLTSSEALLSNQQLATVLSHLDPEAKPDALTKRQHLQFLQNVIQDARKLEELDYFYALRTQQKFGKQLTSAQQERLFEIAHKLSQYIPQNG
ncbi:hypothetical protein ACFVKH_09465 [Almyronema epifaneia S1]|uniref:Uncharacterized protein n=1 Tax=Almyronema epifaneia S1 TaxID=2991925 RepID=A0ABW6IE92_9CYAN